MTTMRKITITASEDLIEFVDERARQTQSNRSRVINDILEAFRQSELNRMAAEGYRFYAEEAVAFAKASAEAVSAAISQDDAMEEVWNNEREAG